MLELSGADRNHLREALTSGFRSYLSLKRWADGLSVQLNLIASSEAIRSAADDLIEHFEERGEVLTLILALHKERPKNTAVQSLMSLLEGRLPGGGTVVRREPSRELALGGEDPRSAYLVIAVFWETRSEKTVRVQPKLCYRDTETREVLQETLVEDDCSIALKDFPTFLTDLVNFTVSRLSNLFPDPLHPWQLTISLFVPVDLLCLPLAKWCGQDGELLSTRPIVLGCSDRFDPCDPGRSAALHNQLKRGWQRFQTKVPDQHGLTLQNLDWLHSDRASQKDFDWEDYSGFQCYGNWLKPDDQYLENWKTLINSGVPLALWMCEGQPERETIAATFALLTNYTRVEFLNYIPRIRKNCNHCVGVFYEDPNYVPEIPKTKEKTFFSWPGA